MTLYQDNQLSWLLSPEHHVECQWFHSKRHQLKVASLGTKYAGPMYQEYSVKPEVANRVDADLGAPQEPPPILGCLRSAGAPRTLHERGTGFRIKVGCGFLFRDRTSQEQLRRSARTVSRQCWSSERGVPRGNVPEIGWSR